MKEDDDIMCYRSELEAAVKAAVAAEREACAEVCDGEATIEGIGHPRKGARPHAAVR